MMVMTMGLWTGIMMVMMMMGLSAGIMMTIGLMCYFARLWIYKFSNVVVFWTKMSFFISDEWFLPPLCHLDVLMSPFSTGHCLEWVWETTDGWKLASKDFLRLFPDFDGISPWNIDSKLFCSGMRLENCELLPIRGKGLRTSRRCNMRASSREQTNTR